MQKRNELVKNLKATNVLTRDLEKKSLIFHPCKLVRSESISVNYYAFQNQRGWPTVNSIRRKQILLT